MLTALLVVVALLSLSTGYLFIRGAGPEGGSTVVVERTTWTAIWTNGTTAPIPGLGDSYLGSCWNLTGPWVPSMVLTCELQFDSGSFGPTPANQHWTSVSSLSIDGPFVLTIPMAVGYFGDAGGPFEITVVLHIEFPSNPGTYAFAGTFLVN